MKKMSVALVAACAGALVVTQARPAQASYATAPESKSQVGIADVGSEPATRLASAINTSRSNIKHGLAVPRKPKQTRAKGQNSGNSPAAGIVVPAKPKPAGSAINTTRSNIKHN
jgi:hypothetical protein